MKKVITLIIVFGLLVTVPFAQQITKIGLGFEFHMFPSTFLMEEGGSAIGVYIPFEFNGIRFEPLISYSSYESEVDFDNANYDDQKMTVTNFELVIGAFKQFGKNNLSFYAGLRVGKFWSTYEETDEEDEDTDSFILAPTVGAEYFISDNFSFGGECMFVMISTEDKRDEYTITLKQTFLMPTFIVRFYF